MNIFQNILNLLKKQGEQPVFPMYDPVKENLKNPPLGAHMDVPDVRRISLEMATGPIQVKPTEEIKTDLSMFPVYSQYLGTCVEEMFCQYKAYLDYKETGKIQKFSRRLGYSLTRNFLGFTEQNGQGLPPMAAGKIATVVGFVPEERFSENASSHEEYVNGITVTDAIRKEANINRASGLLYLTDPSFEGMRNALKTHKLVGGMIVIDYEAIDPDGTVHPVRPGGQMDGLHEVVFCESVIHNGVWKNKFKNSWSELWGDKGYGYVRMDEWDKVFIDGLVIGDVPNDLLKRAQQMQYIFLTTLKRGSSGKDVEQLQKRLVQYGLLASYRVDGKFGAITESAVKEYQKMKGVKADGIIGNDGRKLLNEDAGLKGTTKSKLDMWCLAIQSREGYHAPGTPIGGKRGTPAWRNNNPGNMRKPYSRNVVGYDASNFCIFPDYATGYMELRRMLERACMGLSNTYSKYMTIYQWAEKYAPWSDGNDPKSYAEEVAVKMGVPPTTLIMDLLN